ncbi:MAG: molybdopterin-dependent oxidoreductase, partial [Steroidobacteraceae bacterium]|nr:molybdopterin-dependent oxidoreductase [Steroidobacteraceae bacterium]
MSAPAESPPSLDRRHFLLGSGVVGAGLILGLRLARQRDAGSATDAQRTFTPNAYVRIAPDDTITLVIGKAEMGQGINVGSAVILGEELDVDPQRIRVAFGGVDPAFYHTYQPAQFTGGSMSVQTTYEPLRKAGAAARAMLLAAAAKRWRVDVAQLRTADGRVYDGERSLSYGELAADAAREAVPAEVTLKARREFKYIGRPQRRIDTLEKITGAAQFGIDVRLPDMLTAVIARPPVFGATVRSFDASAARAVAGVVDVKAVPSGVAVVAQNTWAALRGRDALRIDWNLGSNAALDSAALRAQYRRLARQPGTVARSVGDADAAYRAAAPQRRLDVEYELPYLAHACMEPLNAVVHARAGGADLWVGTQNHSQDVDAVARVLGLRPEQVTLHSLFLGGGFGRRAASQSDFVTEAAQVARGYDRPVKVVWTREDDMRGGFYRPYNLTRVRAALDANGLPTCLRYVTVGQSVFAGSPFAAAVIGKDGLDPMSHEGVSNTPYAFAHLQVECHTTEPGVPVLWWRSVGHS